MTVEKSARCTCHAPEHAMNRRAFVKAAGGMGIAAKNAGAQFRYVLINNGAHESVGGQPTIAFDIDVEAVLRAVGFAYVEHAEHPEEIERALRRLKAEPHGALVIAVNQGSRDDLGRPTVSPEENKRAMMAAFAGGDGK